VDGIESLPFHPEIGDDWLLVHQATDPKCPSLTSFFRKKGERDREKALNSLSGFDCSQPSESCLALLMPRGCGAASLMARCATPDVGHPISRTHLVILKVSGTPCISRDSVFSLLCSQMADGPL
jgi:hypothetical protein